MEKNIIDIPHVEIDLPSKGLVYPSDSILSSGKLKLRYMKGSDESILLSPSYQSKGTTFDVLLKRIVLDDGFNVDELTLEDKIYILISIRVMSLGDDYIRTNFMCGNCGLESRELKLKLTDIEENESTIPSKKNTNAFNFDLSINGKSTTLTFSRLTSKDQHEIQEKLNRYNGDEYPIAQYGIAQCLIAVNGKDGMTFGNKLDFVESISLKDFRKIQEKFSELNGNITPYIPHECPQCGHKHKVNVEVTLPFFFPNT